MKKLYTSAMLFAILISNAQIGGGWDWAFNTGSLGGTTYQHLKYTSDGSEIMMGGQALAAAYFGSNTLTAPPQGSSPGNIKFFGKINAATGAPTIIRSFNNIPVNFDCITTDDVGNFYIGGASVSTTDFDFGNGVTIPASAFKMGVIAKFDAAGNTLWAKTFSMGTLGSAADQIFKIAVSPAGNVFFWGFNFTSGNRPLYKLNSNGNTLWFKNASGAGIGSITGKHHLSDKFIDNNENVHLFVKGTGTAGFTFDGVAYPGGNPTYGYATLISLNAAGTVTKGQTFNGGVSNFQVNRTTGNLVFGWSQGGSSQGHIPNLPEHPLASLSPSYVNSFTGMLETDQNFNVIKAKDYSTTLTTPYQLSLSNDLFISLPNGKLLIATDFYKTVPYYVGLNSVYPADPTKYANALIETDTNWNLEKFITGGKAPGVDQTYIAAFNDTYVIGSGFYAEEPGYFTSNPPLPTTSFGTVNLTGFNAAANMTTAYGSFSTGSSLRFDVALAQCKSANFPTIASTTWLGTSNNWNAPSNWSNGVPTNAMKAVFNAPTTNYPTVFSAPTAATLQINAGVTLSLPNNLTLVGGVQNDGIVVLNNAGSFAGLGSNEWKGSGSINFTGTFVSYSYPKMFSNSLILNTDFTTSYSLTIPTITFNSGRLNINSKKLSITNPNPTAISGTSATSYFMNGTLERKINGTGIYEFPVGDFSDFQSATINANGLVGVNSIATTFTSGAITGTTPNATSGTATVSAALNAGWYAINADKQPTAGAYDVTLKIRGATNLAPNASRYVVIKRNNATSPWAVQGNNTLASVVSGTVTASNTGLTSFSDFAVGISNQDIVLSNSNFENKAFQFKLYPNPNSGNLNLNFENPIENGTIKIISLSGQTVFEQQKMSGTDFKLDVSGLNTGLYMIQISDAENNFTSKFIKQ